MKITAPLFVLAVLLPIRLMAGMTDDPWLWLEDVGGERALAWVREQNAPAQRELEGAAGFAALNARLLAILESDARIPYVAKRGRHYYNFWTDRQHVRGIWRRTTLAEYRKPNPAWETVLDLDALAAEEKENWVWKGANFLQPACERCLVSLSRGGADAAVVREFDVTTRRFVPDGFFLPEAKSSIDWRDRDSVYVGTNYGEEPLTDSGYPRTTSEWKRGTPLSEAKRVFAGQKSDVGVSGYVTVEPGFRREFVSRGITFFTREYFLRTEGKLRRVDIPTDASLGTYREHMLVTLRSDWTVGGNTYPTGALITTPWDEFLAGGRRFELLYTPGPRKSLAGLATLRHHLIVNELENVRNRLYVLTPQSGGGWNRAPLDAPAFGSVSVDEVDDEGDDYWLTVTDFLTPTTLYLGTIGRERDQLKASPAFFNPQGLAISQHEAVSKDGTRIPYFQVARQGLRLDGSHPTLLTGYGGFRVSRVPGYSGGLGAGWLESGGVFVLANIRGGGEFGPPWHQAALKEKRQNAYDDFIAVAEDLIARRVTSPRRLGIEGGSNGGLLVGVMFTQRPELFGAVVCRVPLLDMRRYHQLLAGASWMGEYGNPDRPEEWAYISRYSPYHNVRADGRYPRVLFTTSTRDDRVHPGHARKMVAKMKSQGHDVLYYENIEGGHGGAANNRQAAYMSALGYIFLRRQLGNPPAGG